MCDKLKSYEYNIFRKISKNSRNTQFSQDTEH